MEYTWNDVIKIQDGVGKKVCLPEKCEFDKSEKFRIITVGLDGINMEMVSDLKELKAYGEDEDIIAVEGLIEAYRNNEDVPPIVIDKSGEVVDGIHRIAAQIELGRDTVKAFKQM